MFEVFLLPDFVTLPHESAGQWGEDPDLRAAGAAALQDVSPQVGHLGVAQPENRVVVI